MGIENFATLSNGEKIENPKFYIQAEKKLKKLQRRFSKKKKKSKNMNKAKLTLARLHEEITNQRDDFLHKLSRQLINNYDFIAVEKLQISKMLSRNNRIHNHHSILSKYMPLGINSFRCFPTRLKVLVGN